MLSRAAAAAAPREKLYHERVADDAEGDGRRRMVTFKYREKKKKRAQGHVTRSRELCSVGVKRHGEMTGGLVTSRPDAK
ncbi:hypothetical protein EYF80_040808 [Liparis tanakae]|uniref:Uncharacterized protein n=1 Tax=Liparis tanakae TaxID=230148 RepID=A0A4Z2G6W2_9TELE|nr:hypothetical protein EYF80_040808 [Liparis tanakae]